MPDYNIYIHAIGTGSASGESPTTPWSARESVGGAFSQTQSMSNGGNVGGASFSAARFVARAANAAQNPDSVVSSAFAKVAQIFPWVLAAYACVKLGETIIDNVIDFQTIDSGDYRNQIQWQDFKKSISNVFSPISSTISHFKTERQWARENQRRVQERDLLGDSVINSYTRRGV